MIIKEAEKTSKDYEKGSDEWIIARSEEIYMEGEFNEDCDEMDSILAGEISKMWMPEDYEDFTDRVNRLLYED